MGQWTIKLLRRIPTETRLIFAAYLFWVSIILGTYCTVWIAKSPFEKILMAISWLAVTFTALDIILTADVRDNED
jgi:hypothetical protein